MKKNELTNMSLIVGSPPVLQLADGGQASIPYKIIFFYRGNIRFAKLKSAFDLMNFNIL
jgi:hypothetical protein